MVILKYKMSRCIEKYQKRTEYVYRCNYQMKTELFKDGY